MSSAFQTAAGRDMEHHQAATLPVHRSGAISRQPNQRRRPSRARRVEALLALLGDDASLRSTMLSIAEAEHRRRRRPARR